MQPKEIEIVEKIDLAIIPGVAFTTSGIRLGRGGGYYDKFLANKNIYKIGLTSKENVFDYLPQESHDILMDRIIAL
ncbi:5-formyltetrahydrofolate cyclo-ligase, partial [Treponema sp. R6D11]